jgi:hypothetical protein
MQDQPPPGVNRFVWILAASQRIREARADREQASIQRIEAKSYGHAQERQAQQVSPPRHVGG